MKNPVQVVLIKVKNHGIIKDENLRARSNLKVQLNLELRTNCGEHQAFLFFIFYSSSLAMLAFLFSHRVIRQMVMVARWQGQLHPLRLVGFL